MKSLKKYWEAFKGKIAIAGLTLILGLPVVGSFLDIKVIDGSEINNIDPSQQIVMCVTAVDPTVTKEVK